ncbi:hypothetical protein TNIN_334761 [Trichonephila inaurata madagascariensis]|uniref:Uncharacterized protein n=1 Tax=Trichonephila inaurata madagascariensis TaxID=2747483 RepID=A0A8X6WVA4_9ARAC|nr:hypothetical protein TNIN_334761 [Trichonephila inaurata madagascariensis]
MATSSPPPSELNYPLKLYVREYGRFSGRDDGVLKEFYFESRIAFEYELQKLFRTSSSEGKEFADTGNLEDVVFFGRKLSFILFNDSKGS